MCWSQLPRIGSRKCKRCAFPAPREDLDDFLCISCQESDSSLEWLDAWGRYRGGLDLLLQSLKFSRHDFLARPLAELLHQTLSERDDFGFDAIVAVPMHRMKHRRRGFNQAELLARELGRRLRLPCKTSWLVKEQERAAQATLPRQDRVGNVRGVFRADPQVGGKSILLVDDICTTGATMDACAEVLRRAKARRVCGLVVARA